MSQNHDGIPSLIPSSYPTSYTSPTILEDSHISPHLVLQQAPCFCQLVQYSPRLGVLKPYSTDLNWFITRSKLTSASCAEVFILTQQVALRVVVGPLNSSIELTFTLVFYHMKWY